MKFLVTAGVGYIMGHLEYEHLEGIVEASSEEELKEMMEEKYFYRKLDVIADDYSVEDYGDIGEYEYQLLQDGDSND